MQIGDPRLVAEIMRAYRQGAFPMADGRDAAEAGRPLRWYRPDPRAVLPLPGSVGRVPGVTEPYRVPRRLQRTVNSGRFLITSDRAFAAVVRGCAEARRGSAGPNAETWIDARIERIANLLHEAGHAHSFEAWHVHATGELLLVGGVYGIAVGRVFCAESKFSRPELGGTDASKVCLVRLLMHIQSRGFTLMDTQFVNPHLVQFGVAEIAGAAYLRHLDEVGDDTPAWLPLTT
jgi:leucyl/phenylalanyl-tRNA--protein transferase